MSELPTPPITVDISFDDGWMDQLKWSRFMNAAGLAGTFYVCPGLLGTPGYLTEQHLAMVAELGHRIGNHTWEHESPGRSGGVKTVKSCIRARKWLDDKGYDGHILALTCGSRGGRWGVEEVRTLRADGFVGFRDVRFKSELPASFAPAVAALELADLMSLVPGFNAYYFHNNHNTDDDQLMKFLGAIAAWDAAGAVRVVLADGVE